MFGFWYWAVFAVSLFIIGGLGNVIRREYGNVYWVVYLILVFIYGFNYSTIWNVLGGQ